MRRRHSIPSLDAEARTAVRLGSYIRAHSFGRPCNRLARSIPAMVPPVTPPTLKPVATQTCSPDSGSRPM